MRYAQFAHAPQNVLTAVELGQNGIDIEVSRHHNVSGSKYRLTTGWFIFNVIHSHCTWIPGLIHPLNYLHSDFNYFFRNIISSVEYRVSNSILVSYGIEEMMVSSQL